MLVEPAPDRDVTARKGRLRPRRRHDDAIILTAAPDPNRAASEATAPPDEKVIAAYMKYNEDMHVAGVLISSEGINPARQGARIGVSGGKRALLDGPSSSRRSLSAAITRSRSSRAKKPSNGPCAAPSASGATISSRSIP